MTLPIRDIGPASPRQASPGRRLFHLAIATGGWLLFFYWWWLVLRRVDPGQVRFTGIFILVTFTICVLATAGWAFHNLRIWKRRGARTKVPPGVYEFKRDRLGRNIFFADRAELIEKAQVVQIRLEHEGKVYRAFERLGVRPSTGLPAPPAGTMTTTTSTTTTTTTTTSSTPASPSPPSITPPFPAPPSIAPPLPTPPKREQPERP